MLHFRAACDVQLFVYLTADGYIGHLSSSGGVHLARSQYQLRAAFHSPQSAFCAVAGDFNSVASLVY